MVHQAVVREVLFLEGVDPGEAIGFERLFALKLGKSMTEENCKIPPWMSFSGNWRVPESVAEQVGNVGYSTPSFTR